MSTLLTINRKLAAPVAAIIYTRRKLGLPTGPKTIQRLFGYPEARVRRTISLYQLDKNTMEIRLSQIQRHPSLQLRDIKETPQEWIDECIEILEAGHRLPPMVVFHDAKTYWLADGHTRYAAYQQLGITMVDVIVESGDQRDALLYAASANAANGNKRTNADKRKAVMALLSDPEWSKMNNVQIAKHCAVSHQAVANYRKELAIIPNLNDSVKTVTRNGTTYTQNTANIGRKPRSPKKEKEPIEASESEQQESTPQPSLSTTPTPAIAPSKPVRIPADTHNDGVVVQCQAYEHLARPCVDRLRNEVILYRDIQGPLGNLYKAAQAALRQYASRSREVGPLAERLLSLLDAAQPTEWQSCEHCRDELGLSTGTDAFGPCPRCRGFGYRIKSNQEPTS